MKFAQDIILEPIITERSMDMIANKKYVFKVDRKATKPEIAAAVKELFKVDVASVNTMNVKGKPKRMGAFQGRTRSWKKAIVALPEGQRIEFFEGASI